jgi:SAM-dependent methyltransferase
MRRAGEGLASMASQGGVRVQEEASAAGVFACPACEQRVRAGALIERYGKYELFECGACGLHFWEPREMPDARWYERMYGGRDATVLPLEPGHKYFLADPLAPKKGELLDIGCGTGNFLAAARDARYEVTGIELDGNAARFAKEKLGLARVLSLTIAEFALENSGKKFDVVTFFEVLEHQAVPAEFLKNAKNCLRQLGYIALSVPNRERWLTGPDVLDYPPNHFLRWSARALQSFLSANGFEVLSVKEQPAGIAHTAQMISMLLRTGMTRSVGDGASPSFRDIMQMEPEQATKALQVAPTMKQRGMAAMARAKHAACFPMAIAALPFVRMRGLKGTYLYCLAQRKN